MMHTEEYLPILPSSRRILFGCWGWSLTLLPLFVDAVGGKGARDLCKDDVPTFDGCGSRLSLV